MALPSSIIQSGTRAAQPAANAVAAGTLYWVEDEELLERSDGAAWGPYSAAVPPPPVVSLGGCLAVLNTDFTGDFSTPAAIAWDGADVFDDSDYHNPAVDNTKLVVPATGVYLLTCNIRVTNMAAGQFSRLNITKNGATFPGAPGQYMEDLTNAVSIDYSLAGVVTANATEYFEAMFDTESDTSVTIGASQSGFGIYRLA